MRLLLLGAKSGLISLQFLGISFFRIVQAFLNVTLLFYLHLLIDLSTKTGLIEPGCYASNWTVKTIAKVLIQQAFRKLK